jgi:hypothetical protein
MKLAIIWLAIQITSEKFFVKIYSIVVLSRGINSALTYFLPYFAADAKSTFLCLPNLFFF